MNTALQAVPASAAILLLLVLPFSSAAPAQERRLVPMEKKLETTIPNRQLGEQFQDAIKPGSGVSELFHPNRVCAWIDGYGKGGTCGTREPVGSSCKCFVLVPPRKPPAGIRVKEITRVLVPGKVVIIR